MKIRRRDGTMAEVPDHYILQDGEAMMFEMRFMDSRRGLIHDGLGGPVGQRPGYLINDDERAAQNVADAYAAYDADLSTRWQSDRWQNQPSNPTRSAPQAAPQTFDSAEAAHAAVRDAYRQYDEDIQQRWRSR